MALETRLVSSLEKVFTKPELRAIEIKELEAPAGERISFQLALRSNSNLRYRVQIESELEPYVTLREVKTVPCDYPANREDTFLISAEPGIYPDPLLPIQDRPLRLSINNWHAIWVTVQLPNDAAPGTYPITLKIVGDSPASLPWAQGTFEPAVNTIQLTVLPFALPKQKLLNINWFYADCIANYYNLTPWSEPFWELLETYFKDMVDHGNNVLYTPLWTPPLDTGVGLERPTTQLLTITESNGVYDVDFSLLERWLNLAQQCGFEYFELVHMFTQWGAKATPKIIVNGEKRFGWHVSAQSKEYVDFLDAVLPKLIAFLKQKQLQNKCYFHISDEPTLRVIESYKAAAELIRKYVDENEFPIIDAMSEIEFYHLGLLKRPIPVTVTVDRFMNEPIEQRWVYYCGNWQDCLPNRQFGMPSIRTRIIGVLLYLYKMDGFLHWGYNFWFSQFSIDQDIDPWQDPCAGRAHVGGGSFNVYPGKNGPVDAIHFETFAEGLQDLRALQLLEAKIGRDKVVAIIQQNVNYTIDMRHYPHDDAWLLNLRKRINQAICMN